jgi:hypothetical protein
LVILGKNMEYQALQFSPTTGRRFFLPARPEIVISRALVGSALLLGLLTGNALAQTTPSQLTVSIPAGTQNSAGAGTKTCTIGGSSSCDGGLSTGAATDDLFLETITFAGTTFSAAATEIIPGIASVFLEGGGGSNVNAEWGDNDTNSDGNPDPFIKSGWPAEPQESTDIDIINDTLVTVFRERNLLEGIDGEDNDSRLRLIFERAVNDNDPNNLDSVPEIIVFERGLNSDVGLGLILDDGTRSDELTLLSTDFADTGFDINTIEITPNQTLGVVGVDLNEFTFSGQPYNPADGIVVGVIFGSDGGGADIFGVFGTGSPPVEVSDFGDAPDSYDTTLAFDGPRHVLDANLFIGRTPEPEIDGQPSPAADLAIDELLEDGFSLPPTTPVLGPGDTYTLQARATNLTGGPAILCGWIDFNNDGEFDNVDTGIGLNNAERACVTVSTGSISTGATPSTFALDFVLPVDTADSGPDGNNGNFIGRFRLTSDWASAADALPTGSATNGEIEDHRIPSAGTLPVSIVAFKSTTNTEGLLVEWTTASETRNAGFRVWGDDGDGLRVLTEQPVAAIGGDASTPRNYSVLLPRLHSGDLRSLAISAIDFHGKEEFYGHFQPGSGFGEKRQPAPIDWTTIRQDTDRLVQRASARRSLTVSRVHATPAETGLVAVSHSELVSAGLDLTGVPVDHIAVTLKDDAVARDIVGGNSSDGVERFGPGSSIRFWSDKPGFPDALYLDHYSYAILEAPELVRPVRDQQSTWVVFSDRFEPAAGLQQAAGTIAMGPVQFLYQSVWRYEEDRNYHFTSPLADPWSAATLRADASNSHGVHFDLDDALIAGQTSRLTVRVGGLTDFPASPDHHVRVLLNGIELGEAFFEGTTAYDLSVDVPPGTLTAGENLVEVVAPGNSGAPFDLFLLDQIELRYSRSARALDGRLIMDDLAPYGQLSLSGFGPDAIAYARDGEGLIRLGLESSAGDEQTLITTADAAVHWVSEPDRLVSASLTGVANTELLDAGNFDLLVIGHPAFLPAESDPAHPLNDYLAARAAEGWSAGVFSIADIQEQYGWGMALPDALTRFLADADQTLDYEHVLLVGSDSYDYRDHLGLGSVSFIPTRYAGTQFIPHTPSDALMADLDGDGLADKAIGRWPVRSLDDLRSIVQKTLDWESMRGLRNTVWVTDAQDPRQRPFQDQAERMLEPLLGARWSTETMNLIHLDDIQATGDQTAAETARRKFFALLEEGRSLTGFVGHGSPAVWTFSGLLAANDLAELDNEGKPTLITTMTCYTSYFVSPQSDTVAQRWMSGYGIDEEGLVIAGRANGAVAIHGAATLSSYVANERFAREVLKQQLDGLTLGQAVEHARQRARDQGMSDQVINWILLGDPTLKMDR